MTTVLLSPRMAEDWGEALRTAGAGEILLTTPDRPLDAAALARIEVAYWSLDIVGTSTKTVFTKEYDTAARQLLAAPGLKWMHLSAAGADRDLHHALRARGVRITTSSGANALPVAHSALAGMLMLARRTLLWADAQRRHVWEPMRGDAAPRDLNGQSAIMIGLGPIGQTITRLLHAFELKVHGLRHRPQPDDAQRNVYGYDALPRLAPQADWLILAAPLSEATRNLINHDIIARLPRGAHIIQVGRGGQLDETALMEALRSGHLAGAYLDVFATEPIPADSPLWDTPNLIISAHSASAAQGHLGRTGAIFLDNFRRWRAGEPLHNEVS